MRNRKPKGAMRRAAKRKAWKHYVVFDRLGFDEILWVPTAPDWGAVLHPPQGDPTKVRFL